jgi:hypothetical protein
MSETPARGAPGFLGWRVRGEDHMLSQLPASDVTGARVELSSIRKKAGPWNEIHF